MLADHTDVLTREAVASNPAAPESALESLGSDKSESVRFKLAENPHTPTRVLKILAFDVIQSVRWAVANNQNRSFPPVETLAENARAYLEQLQEERRGANENSCSLTQQDLLRALIWIKRVPESADNKTLTRLAHSKDWLSRLGVALHPQASAGQLKLLAKDTNPNVLEIAARRMAIST
jgi:hypothetical protein